MSGLGPKRLLQFRCDRLLLQVCSGYSRCTKPRWALSDVSHRPLRGSDAHRLTPAGLTVVSLCPGKPLSTAATGGCWRRTTPPPPAGWITWPLTTRISSGARPEAGIGADGKLHLDTLKELGATAFFAHSADLLSRMATALDRKADGEKYARLFAHIKQAFLEQYVSADGVIAQSSGSVDGRLAQSNYALALAFRCWTSPLIPRHDPPLRGHPGGQGHPTIGFWSTAGLLLALSANGQHAKRPRCWPWKHRPRGGIWPISRRPLGVLQCRRSESVLEPLDAQFRGRMALAGRRRLSTRTKPIPVMSPLWSIHGRVPRCPGARPKYASVRGPVKIAWRNEARQFTLELTVPATASALVYLPTTDPQAVRESGRPLSQAAGIKWVRQEGEEAVFQVESGSYRLAVAK